MKINPFRPVEMNPYKRQAEKTGKVESPGTVDKVEISAEAKQMQQVPSIVKEREARVAALKEQVQNGTYKVDPESIAESMAKFYRG